MRLIFLRHGARVHDGRDGALTDHGCRQATLAGIWLRDQGYRPTHLQTTETQRAIGTGALAVAQAAPSGCAVLPPRSGMANNPVRWDRLAAELTTRLGADATVLLVGHQPTQDFIERTWARDQRVPAQNHCAVFVIDGEPETGWQCVDVFAGVAPEEQGEG